MLSCVSVDAELMGSIRELRVSILRCEHLSIASHHGQLRHLDSKSEGVLPGRASTSPNVPIHNHVVVPA